MRYIGLAMAFLTATAGGEEWTLPSNLDPQAILQEAQADARAKRYELALAKHVWFHEHVLETHPAMSGVRLSFALMYWHDLGKKFPPALKKLEQARDDAAQDVKEGKNVRESFQDMASINRELKTESLTKDVFVTLDDKHPDAAKQVFHLAQPSLIRGKAYELCGKYVDSEKDFMQMKERFRDNQRMAKDPRFGDRHLEFANKKFVTDATILVAILAVNDHQDKADEVARSAKEEWNNDAFHAELDKALKGIVPEPWP